MRMRDIKPFIRFCDVIEFYAVRGPSKTYDCRFIYVIDGNAKITIEKETYEARHGALFIVQPGMLYKIEPNQKVEVIVVDFDYTQDYTHLTKFLPVCRPDEFEEEKSHGRVLIDEAEMLSEPVALFDMFIIERDLYKIVNEFKLKRILYREKSSGIFFEILLDICRNTILEGGSSELLERIQQAIANSYMKNIKNTDIAKELNYNACYLNRVMLANTKMTLHRFIMQYRFDEAVKLLLSTEKSVGEIAEESGFCSLSHFSNYFKKKTGIYPSEYRKRLSGEPNYTQQ